MTETRTSQCRHGVFTYYSKDRVMGASLGIYGEFSEDEVHMYDAFLKKTDTVIEVGANIGALTVPLSRRCKKVFAFEPQPQTYNMLCMNLQGNGIHNVDVFPYAVGAKNDVVSVPSLDEMEEIQIDYVGVQVGSGSCAVEQHALDNMKFNSKINFMKIDSEGMELEVLIGADKLITHDWPLLYVENVKLHSQTIEEYEKQSAALVGWLVNHGYHCFWHRPRLWHPDNFKNYNNSIFGDTVSYNMICYRDHHKIEADVKARWLTEEVK